MAASVISGYTNTTAKKEGALLSGELSTFKLGLFSNYAIVSDTYQGDQHIVRLKNTTSNYRDLAEVIELGWKPVSSLGKTPAVHGPFGPDISGVYLTIRAYEISRVDLDNTSELDDKYDLPYSCSLGIYVPNDGKVDKQRILDAIGRTISCLSDDADSATYINNLIAGAIVPKAN